MEASAGPQALSSIFRDLIPLGKAEIADGCDISRPPIRQETPSLRKCCRTFPLISCSSQNGQSGAQGGLKASPGSHPQRCSAKAFKQSEGGAGAGQASGTFCSDAGLHLHSQGLCEARFLAVHLPESQARLRAAWCLSRLYTFPSARTHLSQEPVCRQVAREGPPPAPGLRGPE